MSSSPPLLGGPPPSQEQEGRLTGGGAAGTGSTTIHLSVTVSSCWAVSGSRILTITSKRPPVGRRPSRTWVRVVGGRRSDHPRSKRSK